MSQSNRFENTALNEKSYRIIEANANDLAPNKEIIYMKENDSLNLRFVVQDKDGNQDPEFNQQVMVPKWKPKGSTAPDEFTPKQQFRVINMSNNGKSQLLQLGRRHAYTILTLMKDYNTTEVTVKRIGSGKDTNYIALPLQPEPVA